MKKNRKGFTFVEVMAVVAIIGILAVIAIPNFLLSRKKSHQNICIANLKQIQSAKEQSLVANSGITASDLFGNERYIKVEPKCPAGGVYTVGDADANPSCDYTAAAGYEHALPSN
ncbi:MAG: prepilin-type N-terminal cleavage/methylation domain-containing protein [Kiritimatiellae bacterium]|nr:prepilin-type N-terminal cleavage/methylation domain-containing protein [Kiritimatiellia bacterium]